MRTHDAVHASWPMDGDDNDAYKGGVKRACSCCGFLTIDEPGRFEIGPVWFWKDDPVQASDSELSGGANRVSLRAARENFHAIGACEPAAVEHARKPLPDDVPREVRS